MTKAPQENRFTGRTDAAVTRALEEHGVEVLAKFIENVEPELRGNDSNLVRVQFFAGEIEYNVFLSEREIDIHAWPRNLHPRDSYGATATVKRLVRACHPLYERMAKGMFPGRVRG